MRTPTPKGHPPDGPVTDETPEITAPDLPVDGPDNIGDPLVKDLARAQRKQEAEERPVKDA